ncbi:MAG: InlB B-repeat-containing protein [Bacilli bacterium]|nr:InlB B-repeat-containing protein [Bacilli bacterium]
MRNRNNKLKLLIVVLILFLCPFFVKLKDTFGIYRTTLPTTVNLSVLDPNQNYIVRVEKNDGTGTYTNEYRTYNQDLGSLTAPTRTDYNFLGWYDGPGDNANRVYSDYVITSNITIYAHWQKIICKKVTDSNKLHTETCYGTQGCVTGGTGFDKTINNIITYGTTYGVSSPTGGDAYDCDVNNDGTYDSLDQYGKYTERFYFLKEYENNNSEKTATLIYYTSYDSLHGRVNSINDSNIGSDVYATAITWLPTSSTWSNPGLIGFDSNNGNITRFITLDEIENVCGPISRPFPTPPATIAGTSYWTGPDCQKWFLFENSRFQSSDYGRAGIWVQMEDGQRYRIHTQSVSLMSVAASSQNMARPVIEIPLSAFEGYKNVEKHTINFNTHGGTPQIESRRIYTGDPIGSIGTVTKDHYTFDGWYANFYDDQYTNPVSASTLVEGDMILHAKWTPVPTSTVTFDANGGTIDSESTFDLIVDTGDTIDSNDIPVATYAGHTFNGWYYDDKLTEPFDIEEPITDDTTLYAGWLVGNSVAMVNGVGYDTLAEAIAAVPTGKVKTTVTILKNIELSEAVTIPNTKYVELDIGSYTISGSSNLIANQGNLDIISGTMSISSASATTYVITNASGAILNIAGGTVSSSNTSVKNTLIQNSSGGTLNVTSGTLANNCYVAGATTEFIAIENSGTTTISGGTVTSYGQSATINQNGGTLNVNGGEIIAHSVTKGQAIYIAGGTTNIRNSAYLENISGTGDTRGCVDNNGGTLYIYGGTIVSKGASAVVSRKNNTTTQIGTDDSVIDISTPVLRGKKYGLEKQNSPTIKVYDGIFESLDQSQAISTTSVTKPDGINFKTDATVIVQGVTYNAAYLLAPNITINFYEESGGTPIQVVVDNGGTFGNDLPTPSPKQGYLFAGWFIDGDPLYPVTSETTVNSPFTVYAIWVQSVSDATFDDTMTMQINTTDTIEFVEDDIEDVTYSSSDTSVVTVDSDGTVHAVGVGNATITMTGVLSEDTETIDVTVTQTMRTVRFYDSDYDPNDLEHSTLLSTAQVVSGSRISSMPTTPTDTNYVFNAWYINGNSGTPFTSETTVNGDLDVVANWKEKITYANLTTTPSPFEIIVGNTGQIILTASVQGDAVEDYTFTSGNTSYATVNSLTGVVTGAGVGNTNITVTGSLSGTTVQVPVSVDVLKYTVTFKDGNTVIKTVQVESGGTVGEDMPANQSKTNYVFNGWVFNNNNTLTPFTSATEVYGDIDVLVSWKEQINIATLPEDPLTIMLGSSRQVNVTPTGSANLVEDYTLSSSDTNILEVNGKTITGSSVGSVTLTITGVTSNQSETITVNVINSYSVTFDPDNGDSPSVIYVEVNSSIDDSGENLPNNPTKSGYTFDDWYLYDEVNDLVTTTRLSTSASITSDQVYKPRWAGANDVAAIGTTYYTTPANAIAAVTDSTPTEIRILKDYAMGSVRTTVNSGKDITINGNGHELSCSNNTVSNLLYVDGGSLTLKNGTFTCNKSGNATLETSSKTSPKSYLYIEDGATITNTNNRGAVFNSGTTYIRGGILESSTGLRSTIMNGASGSYIEMSGGSVTQTATSFDGDNKFDGQGAIKVGAGTVIITGGTVTSYSTDSAAIDKQGGGTLTIGIDDTNNSYDATSPVIQGEWYGIYATSNYSIYDGIIKGKSNNQAVNDFSKITGTETGTTRRTGTEGAYYTLYYELPNLKYRIEFDANDGEVSPLYKEFNVNSPITTSDLPTPTRANHTFDGWYTDSNLQTPFANFTPTAAATTTYYAKWTFNSSLTPVSHNVLSTAMQQYFSNVSTWVAADATDPSNPSPPAVAPQTQTDYDNGHHLFKNSIDQVFNNNSCSYCAESSGSSTHANNDCNNPSTGTYCDQAEGYDTGLTENLNVYTYENGVKSQNVVSYITSTGGVIYNMIPGVTYFWESANDNTKYGVVTATGNRRTLKTSVRNLRDLGGLSASNSDVTGTIDYGRLYRGAYISSAQGVTDLTKLGVTREVDLRGDGDGVQTYKMTNYDTGTSSSYNDIVITNYIVNPTATTYIEKAYPGNYTAVKSALREIMEKVVFDHDSIFFHCTIGTDRTGTLAYFLEGLLGVSEEDRLRDYDLTYFFGLTNRTRFHDTSGWSSIAPRFYSMYRSYPTNANIYSYYTHEPHVVNPNKANDLTDDELLRRFRLELIH